MTLALETALLVASASSLGSAPNPYWTSLTSPSFQLDDVAEEGAPLLGELGCDLVTNGPIQSVTLVDGDVIAGMPESWVDGSCVQNMLAMGAAVRIRSSETPSVIEWIVEDNSYNEVNLFAASTCTSGEYMVFGAPWHSVDQKRLGRVDLFAFDSEHDSWFFANELHPGDDRLHFGMQTAGTSQWLAVGNVGPDTVPDHASVSILRAPSFTEVVTIDAPEESSAGFGSSLALHEQRGPNEETFLIAGAPVTESITSESGAAYIYHTVDGQWSPDPARLTPEEWKVGQFGDGIRDTDCLGFGYAVEITEAGGHLWAFVGEPKSDAPGVDFNGSYDTNHAGCVYVYQYQGGGWTQVQKVYPPDGVFDGHFGWSLASDEDIVVVGAPQSGGQDASPGAPQDPHHALDGAVYILRLSEGRWILAERLDRTCEPSDHGRVGHVVDVDVRDDGDIHIVSGSGLILVEWVVEGTLDVAVDCNANGILDATEIGAGVGRDANEDGVLDACQLDTHDANGNGVPDDYEQGASTRLAVVVIVEGAQGTSQEAFDLQISGLMESMGSVSSTPWPLDGRVLVTVVDEHGPTEPFRTPDITPEAIFVPLEVSPDDPDRTTLADRIEMLSKTDGNDNLRYLNKRLAHALDAVEDLATTLASDDDEDTSIDQFRRLIVLMGDAGFPGVEPENDCPYMEVNGVWEAMFLAANTRLSVPRTRICAGLLGGGNCDGATQTDAAMVLGAVANMPSSPTLQVTDDVGLLGCIEQPADIVALCEACGDGLIGTISCEWDLDGDGVVNVNDLLDVIAGFGTIYTVNDLLAVLSDFGCNSTSPPPIG